MHTENASVPDTVASATGGNKTDKAPAVMELSSGRNKTHKTTGK